MKKQLKYIKKAKPKNFVSIYDRLEIIVDKVNQIVKVINELKQ